MSVLLYHCILCVSLLEYLFVLCDVRLTVFVKLFGETIIRNMFGRGCYFVVECYGCV